jgi:hypothetical protein
MYENRIMKASKKLFKGKRAGVGGMVEYLPSKY